MEKYILPKGIILPKENKELGKRFFSELRDYIAIKIKSKTNYLYGKDDMIWYTFVGSYFWKPIDKPKTSKEYKATFEKAIDDTYEFYKAIGNYKAIEKTGLPNHCDPYELLIDAGLMK